MTMTEEMSKPYVFPYRVVKDEHNIWHIRKLDNNECVGCVEGDIFEILRGYFTLSPTATDEREDAT